MANLIPFFDAFAKPPFLNQQKAIEIITKLAGKEF
jgi:hypothetical protein